MMAGPGVAPRERGRRSRADGRGIHGQNLSAERRYPGDQLGVHSADPPHLHSFANGLELDQGTLDAGWTLRYHNGRTEGVNCKTKMIKRQMFGRAGFDLLRHRILLG